MKLRTGASADRPPVSSICPHSHHKSPATLAESSDHFTHHLMTYLGPGKDINEAPGLPRRARRVLQTAAPAIVTSACEGGGHRAPHPGALSPEACVAPPARAELVPAASGTPCPGARRDEMMRRLMYGGFMERPTPPTFTHRLCLRVLKLSRTLCADAIVASSRTLAVSRSRSQRCDGRRDRCGGPLSPYALSATGTANS